MYNKLYDTFMSEVNINDLTQQFLNIVILRCNLNPHQIDILRDQFSCIIHQRLIDFGLGNDISIDDLCQQLMTSLNLNKSN